MDYKEELVINFLRVLCALCGENRPINSILSGYLVGHLDLTVLFARLEQGQQHFQGRFAPVPILGSVCFDVRNLIESFSAINKDKKVWR